MLKRKVSKMLARQVPGGTSFSHKGNLSDLPHSVLVGCGMKVPQQEEHILKPVNTSAFSELPGMILDLAAFRVPRR